MWTLVWEYYRRKQRLNAMTRAIERNGWNSLLGTAIRHGRWFER